MDQSKINHKLRYLNKAIKDSKSRIKGYRELRKALTFIVESYNNGSRSVHYSADCYNIFTAEFVENYFGDKLSGVKFKIVVTNSTDYVLDMWRVHIIFKD